MAEQASSDGNKGSEGEILEALARLRGSYATRFDASIEACGRSMGSQLTATFAVQQFVDRFSRQSWEETLRGLVA